MATIRKRTTAADVAAAVKLGTLNPDTELVTAAEARVAQSAMDAAMASGGPVIERSGTEHDCAIPGCRHGAAHGPTQPDRQVKLQCPGCGAVARMTARAIGLTGGKGIECAADGVLFEVAQRRTYSRKVAA